MSVAVAFLRADPLPPLTAAADPALAHLARRDLMGDQSPPAVPLAESPGARRLLGRQRPDGGWTYPGGHEAIRSRADYDQLETFRSLGALVQKYELDRSHPAVARAAEFLAGFQTRAGDYRGIYGRQYTPNYTAAITELLIRAGLDGTPQVESAMRWLVGIRQDDGGWAIPTRTLGMLLTPMLREKDAREPDRSSPSAHLVTGIVLRAFAAHPLYRRSEVAAGAARLLKSRLLRRDAYPDHQAPSHWLVFSYPFWWTDLLSALDSLTLCGFAAQDPDVALGLAWFRDNQDPGGLWNRGRNRPKAPDADLWVALAVCRVLKRVGLF